ncbi:hypothetical protein GGI12_004263 [Dipsacomyces acuminosporus]|nr:hypothetical protein GGI12_004263 [Dipsacomyces acuminosporus]
MPSLLHLGWWVDLDEEASLIHGYHRLSEAGDISKPIHTKLESLEVTCVDNSVGDNECLDVDIDTAYEIAEFVVRIPSMKRVSVNSRNGAEQVRSGIGFYKNIGTSRQYTQHCAGLVISETE